MIEYDDERVLWPESLKKGRSYVSTVLTLMAIGAWIAVCAFTVTSDLMKADSQPVAVAIQSPALTAPAEPPKVIEPPVKETSSAPQLALGVDDRLDVIATVGSVGVKPPAVVEQSRESAPAPQIVPAAELTFAKGYAIRRAAIDQNQSNVVLPRVPVDTARSASAKPVTKKLQKHAHVKPRKPMVTGGQMYQFPNRETADYRRDWDSAYYRRNRVTAEFRRDREAADYRRNRGFFGSGGSDRFW